MADSALATRVLWSMKNFIKPTVQDNICIFDKEKLEKEMNDNY